ncbi:hypothetical protein RISK_005524 [Rhodopirellula islandica]|uniref:Uncharacterized protein n=1 Tax=Rhodopirellula islandica TaxID=595434 RepID=A0A0J1B7A8_RHOIS|nr:hypothetical protein RISK_005524 [Rhodopirellula islandica]
MLKNCISNRFRIALRTDLIRIDHPPGDGCLTKLISKREAVSP